MQQGRSSETAYRAALARALHQVVDTPRVFDDPMAHKLLRPQDAQALQRNPERGGRVQRGLRMALAVRSRMAEEALHEAMRRGVRQYVVLGAGFDTFALRNPYAPEALRVFEVDHPSTQAAKREQLAQAGLALPESLCFVPVDFGAQSLEAQLMAAGFNTREPAFFALLGVSMYLEPQALQQTLAFIASCASGTELVFDYVVTPASLPWRDRLALHLVAFRCARLGEPWKSFFDPQVLPGRLAQWGFSHSHEISREEIMNRLSGLLDTQARPDPPRFGMGRLMRARV